jgi:hypothetical protein
MSTKGIFADLLSERKNILNLVIITVVASIGVNLVADGLIALFMSHFQTVIVIGITLCISSILYFLLLMFTKRNKTRILLGFFIVNYENKEVISITRYPYAEDLVNYIEAATTENQDIKRIWRKSFEIKTPDFSESDNDKLNAYLRERADFPSGRLIKEATEYFVLEMLSMHLTDNFADHQFREENLRSLTESIFRLS